MTYSWQRVTIHPWVGESFESPRCLPHRTLILGESNYTTRSNFTEKLVVSCVEEHLDQNPDEVFSRFATKILRVVFGDEQISPREFWTNVAFYNFVQSCVGETSRIRPKSKHWQDSVPEIGRAHV